MKVPKISLGSWAFSFGPYESDPWPFSKLLEYCANTGYDGVEINGFRPHPHPEDYDTQDKCEELFKQIHGLGLGISGYAPDFRDVPPASAGEEQYLSVVRKCLRFCNNCGIDVLRVDSVNPPEQLSADEYESRFATMAKTWKRAAEECQKAGVLLVWEFEPGFWLNKPSEILRMYSSVGHENFKLLFDTSHAYMVSVVGARHTGETEKLDGGDVELANMYKDAIGHLHIIDSDGTLHNDETSTHAPFGTGYVDFKKVLGAIKPVVEKLEWWCVDFCFCPTTDRDAAHAVPFLKDLAKQL